MSKNKVRLSLDVSPEVNELLDNLAVSTGGTKSNVICKAIALMEVAAKAKKDGLKIGIADQNQELKTEIIGI